MNCNEKRKSSLSLREARCPRPAMHGGSFPLRSCRWIALTWPKPGSILQKFLAWEGCAETPLITPRKSYLSEVYFIFHQTHTYSLYSISTEAEAKAQRLASSSRERLVREPGLWLV